MSRIFALLVLSVGISFGGVCKSPKCTGDETTCESTPGCYWDGESAYCGGPDCDSASSQSACTAIKNCAWKPSPSTCSRPSSSFCGKLAESNCSKNGCAWVAPSSRCSGPTYEQCRAKNQTECQNETSGCNWYWSGSSGGCNYPSCGGLSPTACGGVKGCQWRPGTCDYSVSYCGTLSENACKNDGNCKYTPARAGCYHPSNSGSSSQDNACTNLNPDICKNTPGCQYQEDQYGCYSDSFNVSCSYNYNPSNYSDFNCSAGCSKKVSYSGRCQSSGSNYVSCSNNTENTDCSSASKVLGCIWDSNYQRGSCGYNFGCEGLSESACNANSYCSYWQQTSGSCNDDPKLDSCASLDADTCSSTNYCELLNVVYGCTDPDGVGCTVVISGGEASCSDVSCNLTRNGDCRPKEYYCYTFNYDPTGCSASEGCVYQDGTGVCQQSMFPPSDGGDDGYDEVASGQQRSLGALPVCSINADNTGCASNSPSGCSFSAGYCSSGSLGCQTGVNDCTQTSKDAGCVWSPGSGTVDGYCDSSSSRWKCYKNAAGTDCDTNWSLDYCTFQSSPGYCTSNSQTTCIVKADGNGCDESSDDGCKWIEDRGYCSNALTCYENAAGDGCDKTDGDAGCTWYKAIPPSCKPYPSEYCFSNATGDGCAVVSIEAGCVWGEGSAASLIHVPMLLLLVVLLLNL